MNVVKLYEESGGPLLVNNHLGGLVLWDELLIFCWYCFCGLGRCYVYEGIYGKGVTYEEIFLAMEGEEVSGSVLPLAIWDVSVYHRLCCLVFGKNVASFDIIGYVCINFWPVNCCSSYDL